MSPRQNLAHNQQIAHLHSTWDHCHGPNTSSASASLSHSQSLADADLFATLLFDRQRAYQRTSSILPIPRFSQSTTREITHATQYFLALGHEKLSKHPQVHTDEKEQRHNMEKQKLWKTVMVPSTRAMSERQKWNAMEKREVKVLQTKATSNKRLKQSIVGKNSESETDVIMVSSNEEVQTKKESDEAQIIQQLREELHAANAKIKQLQDFLETKQQSISQDKLETSKVDNNVLRRPSQDVTQTKEVETSSKEEASTKEEDSVHKEITPPQVTNNHIAPTPLTATENPQPKPPSSQPIRPIGLPHKSNNISSNAEDIKLENVRATYMKVKRKLESLKGIGKKLDSCTKTMDLSSFGEFGMHMRRLREWLEEEQQQQQQQQQRRQ